MLVGANSRKLDINVSPLIGQNIYLMKQVYKSPSIKVVAFRVESGYALSMMTIAHEVFLEEISGNESFQDETSDDISSYDWTIF